MSKVQADMLKLLDAAQKTPGCHQKNIFLLRKLYQQSGFEHFSKTLISLIDGLLRIDYKIKNISFERIMDFISMFCAFLTKVKIIDEDRLIDDPLIDTIFLHLLEASSAASENVCFLSFQMLNKMLNHLSGYEIGDDLFTHMQSILIDRLWDDNSAIRVQTIDIICRLQDRSNTNDPVIKRFIELLHDSVAVVRQRCVEKLILRADSIEGILNRITDVNVNVRLAAFKRLSKCAKNIKISDRRNILSAAIYHNNKNITKYIYTHLLPEWWETYNCNIIKLMLAVRLDGDESDLKFTSKLFEIILNRFFFKGRPHNQLVAVLPLTDEKLIPYKELNVEIASYWRELVSLLAENGDLDIYVENVVPDVSIFCRYVKDYLLAEGEETYLIQQYIIQQLFLIIPTYDLGDSYSFESVQTLVEYFLKSGDLIDESIEIIAGTLNLIIPDCEAQCQIGMKIISDLLYPVDDEHELDKHLNRDVELAKLKVRLNTLRKDLEDAIVETDFKKANELKEGIKLIESEIKSLNNPVAMAIQTKTEDVQIICQCLDIIWALLRTAYTFKLTTTMKNLKTEFVTDLLIHQNEEVRFKALRTYAVYCVYDKTIARTGIHVFALPIFAYQAGEECESRTLITCISVISDLLRIYGSNLLPNPEQDQLSDSVNEEHVTIFTGGTSVSALIQGLVDLMEDELYEVQLKATEGLCKLLLDEAISSPTVISRLILKWCNPINNDELETSSLKQFIGYILEKLPHLSNGYKQLEGAVLPTIETLVRAPKTSPLVKVDIDEIAKFLLALCKVSHKGSILHSNLALAMCSQINHAPEDKINTIFSKMLLMVDLPEDRHTLRRMAQLLKDAGEYTGKAITQKLTKVLSTINRKLVSETSEESLSDLDDELSEREDEECISGN